MDYYLLTLNPKYLSWNDAPEKKYGNIKTKRWSCGTRKDIQPNDKVFFLKLGKNPRGIFASGTVMSTVYKEKHWKDKNRKASYVDVRIDKEVEFGGEFFLSREYLAGLSYEFNWSPRSSGIKISKDIGEYLEEIFGKNSEESYGIEVPEVMKGKKYIEGATMEVTINRYERNPNARKACIDHYGYNCIACGINLEKKYGDRAKEFIHIHHEKPLSTIKKGYVVNPINDLKPVCPNCHAIIHRKKDCLSIKELREMICSE